jgi:hypothetical protein
MDPEILTHRNISRIIIFAIALTAGFPVSGAQPAGLSHAVCPTLGIFVTAAILRMVESFPLYITSFVIVAPDVILLWRPGGFMLECKT